MGTMTMTAEAVAEQSALSCLATAKEAAAVTLTSTRQSTLPRAPTAPPLSSTAATPMVAVSASLRQSLASVRTADGFWPPRRAPQ